MTRAYKDFDVNLTLRLSTRVTFARDTLAELDDIGISDAIENAIGSLPITTGPEGDKYTLIEWLEGEGFAVALPIDGEVTDIDVMGD